MALSFVGRCETERFHDADAAGILGPCRHWARSSTLLEQASVVEHFTVVDHFGWPTDLSDSGRRTHLDRLGELAASPNVATRIDAVGAIFGAWTAEQARPWLLAVVALFGPERCMLGSDIPIERLRSGFEPLYRAYDEIFAEHTPRDREMLLGGTAEQWYGAG